MTRALAVTVAAERGSAYVVVLLRSAALGRASPAIRRSTGMPCTAGSRRLTSCTAFYDGQPDVESQAIMAAVERRAPMKLRLRTWCSCPWICRRTRNSPNVPPDIKEAWDKQSSKQTPWYLISSPVGVHIFGGTIAETDMAALVDSPLRQRDRPAAGTGQGGRVCAGDHRRPAGQ